MCVCGTNPQCCPLGDMARRLSRGRAALLHSAEVTALQCTLAQGPTRDKGSKKQTLPVDPLESRTVPPSASPLPLALGCNPLLTTRLQEQGLKLGHQVWDCPCHV